MERPLSILKNLHEYRVIDRRRLYAHWERFQLNQVLRELDIDCVFDVGANEGQYATMLRQKCGFAGHIISFEPGPEPAAKLRACMAKDPKWSLEEVALSDKIGSIQFHVMADSQFSSLSDPRHDEVDFFRGANSIRETLTVRSDTLSNAYDRLVKQYGFRRPFLKMDTQGFDVNIAKASEEVLGRFVGLQSELAIKKLYADSVNYVEAIAYYESCGFVLTGLIPNNSGIFPYLVEIDCLMTNRSFLS